MGRNDAARMTLEQANADLLLQLADLRADGGLREFQSRRRMRDIARFDDFGEIP
jgi:hypothetical protein